MTVSDRTDRRVAPATVRAVWEYITLHPNAPAPRIGKALHVDGSTVSRALNVLESCGYIARPARSQCGRTVLVPFARQLRNG